MLLASFSEHVVTVDVAEPVLESSSGYNVITIPEMFVLDQEGFASLPGIVSYYPVPPGQELVLNWSVNTLENTGWSSSIIMASSPELIGSGLESVELVSSARFPDEHQPVSFEVIHLLGTTVAKIAVSPFCYGSPEKYASSITYSLSFEDVAGGRSVSGTLLEALCPDAEVWWPYTGRSYESPFWGKPWARIKVKNTGFYSITAEELEASGCFVIGVPSVSLSLYSGSAEMFDIQNPGDEHLLEPVAITVFDGGDGVFDQLDSLVFYGQDLWHWNFEADTVYRSYHRYDTANSYWLTWGGSNGTRISETSVAPSGGIEISEGLAYFGFEEEIFWDVKEQRTGWVWGNLSGTSPGYYYLSVPFATELATVNLSMLHGGGSYEHQVSAELEDIMILDTLYRSGVVEYFSIDSVVVQKGGNLLKVWNDHPSGAKFDYAEIILPIDLSYSAGNRIVFYDYEPDIYSMSFGSVSSNSHLYDLSDPKNPIELIDWNLNSTEAELSYSFESTPVILSAVNSVHYFSVESIESSAPGRIIDTSAQADVIITVPNDMIAGVSALEALYAARGLTTLVVSYQEIYDEFNQGVFDPGAVRSFVRWALDSWSSPPGALLLIGDGSNDPLGYTTGLNTNSPVYITLRTNKCLDSDFTIVHPDGETPEIPVSRIPASNLDELQIAIGKAITLENSSVLGPWANRVLLVADDEWGEYSWEEEESTEICEFLADSIIPTRVNIEKLYEIEYPWPPGTSTGGVHPTKPEASADFIQELNEGVIYTAFLGHGSYDQMTHEKLFSSEMVSQLVNAPRYFLYASFSCDNGFFDLASGDCLSEILLFHPGGGASATIACTRGSLHSGNRVLSEQLFSRLHEGDYTVAEALWLAQLSIDNDNNYLYPVLGDGGITLPRVEIEGCFVMPSDTLRRGQVGSIDVTLPGETSFLFRALESADSVSYVSPLSEGFVIDYVRFGSEMYSSIISTNQVGNAQVVFFVPLQADTGSFARVDATGRIVEEMNTGYSWPEPLIDDGCYVDDTEGPLINLSFLDSQSSGEIPAVYQNSTLHVTLSDSSGICILGNDAGSSIIGSIDGGYEDLTHLFSYDRESYITGALDYVLPELLPGIHEVRVVARDGMKNTGEGVLSFNVLRGSPPLLEETGVYPNPGRRQRAFFFTTSSAGDVEISIYTVSGRPVWQDEILVQDGVNQLVWNGLDADGDTLAAGVYVYKIKFSGGEGSTSVSEILVVSP